MPDTILMTGGAGTLGRATTPLLAETGARVRILDLVGGEPRAGLEWIVGDLRRTDDVRRAMDGVSTVVHAAAWHGMHLRDHTPREFWELNVDATFTVWGPIREWYDIGLARSELGWQPRYGFDAFLGALRADRSAL